MRPIDGEVRPIDIWEQLRKIEDELFLLAGRARELDPENHRRRIGRLRSERTHLAGQLLLKELR
jgi:hypothetical protein